MTGARRSEAERASRESGDEARGHCGNRDADHHRVWHSLQSRDGAPLDPQGSADGEPLAFDFAVRVGPGPKFFGDQVRPEGPLRRFVYVRVGQAAGDHASP